MADSPRTRASLLVRIRDARDTQAWSQFVEVYAPLVYGFARKHGLQDADSADLVQDVLRAVAGAIGRLDYDARAGTFRGWLFTIARNKLRDLLRARNGAAQGTGDSGVHQFLDSVTAVEDEQEWNAEYERQIFSQAAELVRREVSDTTWEAFRRTALDGKSGQEVAAELGMTVAAVYLARGRVMTRLKDEVQSLREGEEESSA